MINRNLVNLPAASLPILGADEFFLSKASTIESVKSTFSELPASYSPTNYVPASSTISGHLQGIDAQLVGGLSPQAGRVDNGGAAGGFIAVNTNLTAINLPVVVPFTVGGYTVIPSPSGAIDSNASGVFQVDVVLRITPGITQLYTVAVGLSPANLFLTQQIDGVAAQREIVSLGCLVDLSAGPPPTPIVVLASNAGVVDTLVVDQFIFTVVTV